jgi:hypothetical protein
MLHTLTRSALSRVYNSESILPDPEALAWDHVRRNPVNKSKSKRRFVCVICVICGLTVSKALIKSPQITQITQMWYGSQNCGLWTLDLGLK